MTTARRHYQATSGQHVEATDFRIGWQDREHSRGNQRPVSPLETTSVLGVVTEEKRRRAPEQRSSRVDEIHVRTDPRVIVQEIRVGGVVTASGRPGRNVIVAQVGIVFAARDGVG